MRNLPPGTWITLPDKRKGTVVYHRGDGYGIKWGHIELDENDIEEIIKGENIEWEQDAMLRDHYSAAQYECVGEEYEIVEKQ